MALVKRTPEPAGVEVIDAGGAQVVKGAYASLNDAVRDIFEALKAGERGRLTIVKAIDQITKLELYRDEGFTSMASYMPKLIELCNEVSWKSGSSIKHSLTWYRLYVLALEYDPDEALKAVSHLGILARLADVSRKTGELAEDDNLEKAKLGKVKFDDLGRLVVRLVNGFPNQIISQVLGAARIEELNAKVKAPAGATPKQVVAMAGLDGTELAELLRAVHLEAAATTYQGIVRQELALPPKGWKTADTQTIVDALVKKEEAVEDEEAAATEQVYVGFQTFDGGVQVERIEYRNSEGVILATIQVGEVFTQAMFKRISKGATAEIAGVDGEQGGE